MPRREPPRYVRNMVADHLRRDHRIPTLDPGEIGMRTSRRRPTGVRWHDDPTDPLGAWFRCERCRQRHGEGWERYYAAVYWPWPLPHHLDAIAAHYHHQHPGVPFDPGRVAAPGHSQSEWQASFLPLTPSAPSGFLCAACRPQDEPRLARRVVIGSDAYSDARRLRALRAARTDLRPDLAGRTPLQPALGSQTSVGGESIYTVPSGELTDGVTYKWRARGYDGTDYGAWSGYRTFTEDVSAPTAPSLSSTTDPNQTSWYTSQSYTVSFSSTDTGGSGVAGYPGRNRDKLHPPS